jgi:preprotein translocase subunit SecB
MPFARFVFNPIEYRGKEAYELQYFDAPNGNLKGTVALFDVEVYCETKSTHKRVKFEFQLLLQNGGIFQLSCETEEDREQWIASLNIVIAYLRKVVLSSG